MEYPDFEGEFPDSAGESPGFAGEFPGFAGEYPGFEGVGADLGDPGVDGAWIEGAYRGPCLGEAGVGTWGVVASLRAGYVGGGSGGGPGESRGDVGGERRSGA